MKCPCNDNEKYSLCCGRYHLGNLHPATAEVLLRSRYSAYALNKIGYIHRTWHEETRPKLEILRLKGTIAYQSLSIISTDMGLDHHDIGMVTSSVTYQKGKNLEKYYELSSFKRVDAKWFFFKSSPLTKKN